MKVALCLHGYFDSKMDHTSTGEEGYNHIKKHILDKGDVDVYIHSWQPEKEKEISKLYKPKRSIFEPQKDFSFEVREKGLASLPGDSPLGRSPFTTLSHFYSIQKAMELVPFSKYDIVVKSRFDLGRINRNTSGPGKQNPFPVQCIHFDPELPMDKMYMANWQYFDDGPADMWFYSGAENMLNFKSIYNDVHRHLTADNINAIKLYKWWMEENGLWEIKQPLDTEWE